MVKLWILVFCRKQMYAKLYKIGQENEIAIAKFAMWSDV